MDGKLPSIRIQDLTWEEVGTAVQNGYETAIFALGSTEQHGPALPEDTDTVQAEYVANRLAVKLGNTLQAPTISVGCSDHHLGFPGTLSLRKETLQAVVEDFVASLGRHGFRRIVILPFHGGNFAPVADILPKLRGKHPGLNLIVFTDFAALIRHMDGVGLELGFTAKELGGHADVWETSNMLFIDRSRVRDSRLAQGYPGPYGKKEMADLFEKGVGELSEIGILGDSRRAGEKYGQMFLDRLVDFLYDDIYGRWAGGG